MANLFEVFALPDNVKLPISPVYVVERCIKIFPVLSNRIPLPENACNLKLPASFLNVVVLIPPSAVLVSLF